MTDLLHISINLQFGGGVELLFDNKKTLKIELPNTDQLHDDWTLKKLILYMKDNILNERPELFVQGDNIRPGILVLVNDVDWELMGESNYILKPNDTITFISTLHGG